MVLAPAAAAAPSAYSLAAPFPTDTDPLAIADNPTTHPAYVLGRGRANTGELTIINGPAGPRFCPAVFGAIGDKRSPYGYPTGAEFHFGGSLLFGQNPFYAQYFQRGIVRWQKEYGYFAFHW